MTLFHALGLTLFGHCNLVNIKDLPNSHFISEIDFSYSLSRATNF
ncbi:MAG: hypothetical protein CMIDDMOC_00442 [Sodalis sp. Fle]|nr:MAG: hypothetical protein CMIDDMOC_00442 [Sodalis sp. Fle]